MPRPPNTPSELLAALPATLGRPLNPPEAVLLGWADAAPELLVVLTRTLGHDSDPRDEADLARQALVDGAEQVALVVASTEHGAQWYPTPDLVARYIAATCGRYGLDLLDALTVVGDRWRSLACADPTCCPPEGNPMPHLTKETPTP